MDNQQNIPMINIELGYIQIDNKNREKYSL